MDNVLLNDGETETLISNLQTQRDDITRTLNSLNDLVSKLSSAMEGDLSQQIVNKFSYYSVQFPTITGNLDSYVKDFQKLLSEFKDQGSTTKVGDIANAQKGGELVNVNI